MEPGSKVKAIYDFQGTDPSELTFRAGDVVEIVEKIDDNWFSGTLNGNTGSFPSSYVTSLVQKQVVAKETFPANAEGDLAFKKGDVIKVLDKIDGNWWRGQLGSNIGIFPVNYVEDYDQKGSTQSPGGETQKAKALQDLTGQLHDELSFKKNDIIVITEKVDADWYRGVLNGTSGLVPAFCVELLSDASHSSPTSPPVNYSKLNESLRKSLQGAAGTVPETQTIKAHQPKTEQSEPWATTLYPFSADNKGELSFMDGEKIILTGRIDDQWLEGRIDGRVGVFPSNYVKVVVDLPPGEYAAQTNMTARTNQASNGMDKCRGMQGKALFDFTADTEQDLPLKTGEMITIVEKVDADWYEGKNLGGQVGFCPVNYIEIVTAKPKKRPAPKPPSKKSPTKAAATPPVLSTATPASIEQSVVSPPAMPVSVSENHSMQPVEQPNAVDVTAVFPNTEQTPPLLQGGGDTPLVSGSASAGPLDAPAPTQDPLLPSVYKPGGSSYKSVSFAPKGMSSSSSGDSTKGEMLQRQDAVSQQSPPAVDLSIFDSLAPVQPTESSSLAPQAEKTLLDASPVVEASVDILAPSKPVDNPTKVADSSSFPFDPLFAPTPFVPGAHTGVRPVHGPVTGGAHKSAASSHLTSDFDPLKPESAPREAIVPQGPPPLIPSSAPVAKPTTLETKLRSISQVSQDLDEFFGTTDSYTSRVSTIDSIDNMLDPLGPSAAVAMETQKFVPFTEVPPPPPVPPRQPSPNPFAASFEPPQQSAIISPPSTASTASSRQSSLDVTPGWQSMNYSMDSVASDDAGYYHGLSFSIKPLGDSPPVGGGGGGTAFKLPPPPSSPRRPRRLPSEERPQSPKFDPKTAVPRPKPRRSVESTSSVGSAVLQLSAPPPGHLRTNTDSRAKVSEALESLEWNVGELQRTDSVDSKPPPSHPPPSLLIDVDSEVSAITSQSETVSQSSGSAVDDLLGLGDPFTDVQPSAATTATTTDASVKPSRPAPPAPQTVELIKPPVNSEMPLSPSRTINIDVTLTFENEDFFSTGKAPPVARPPPPKKVPPRPAPPRSRPQTIVEDEILGPLRPGGRAMDQNEEYIASLEVRINQLDVEIYANKESKTKLEEMIKVVSEENREEVTCQLKECDAEIDKLTEEQNWVKGELKQLRPDPIGDIKRKNAQMRTKVVDELMKTERDYVKDIKLCYEGFIGSLKGQKFQTLIARTKTAQQEEENNKNKLSKSATKGLELDILFGNVEHVIDVSERFLENLEENISRKPIEEQLAGLCFLDFSKELEEKYSQYCRNHDEAIALLEKYEDNPEIQEYISDGLAIVRQSTNCWDLASFLIKPVQRILKYPLLLNELIKVTEDEHIDKSNLLQAINTMTDVATAINEFKRRKDLVLKYRKSDTDTISNKLGKLNLHSIRKKSQRMNQRFSQVTGLVTQTVDEEFVEEERKFRDLEKTIKIFVKDVNTYLEKLQEATSEQAVLSEDIADYYANQANLDEVAKYSKSQRDLANKLYKNYTLFVQQRVVSPLNQLLIMFQGPHKLIQKRFDKLLDYDSALQKGEKSKSEKTKSKLKEIEEEKESDSPKVTKYQGIKEKDKDKQPKETKDERKLALKNYEALNKQLLDEMPKLYSMSITLLKECVQSFIEAERDHFDATLKHLYPLLKLPMILDSSRENILNDFNTKNEQATEKFMSFTFVPRNFDKKSGDKKSIKKVPSPTKQAQTQQLATQGDGQKTYLLSKYLSDQLHRITLDYTARDSMDISVKKGDLVGVIKKQDPMGGSEKWYVDNGASQGFVPSCIMEPCGDELKGAPIASISDLSSSSQSQAEVSFTEEDYGARSHQYQQEPQEPVCQYYYAEWAFEATGPNEVSLGEGEAVRVVAQYDLEGNPEWWLVEKNGQQGYVPANYLARIE